MAAGAGCGAADRRLRDGRSVLAAQHLTEPGDVHRQRGLGELRGGDVVAVGLETLDDAAPRAVHQDNVRLDGHISDSPHGDDVNHRLVSTL
jgi:hypothetical protein